MTESTLRIPVELETKGFDKQINKVEDDLQELLYKYDDLEKSKAFEGKTEELRKLEIEIEKAKNKLVQLYGQQNKINEQTRGTTFKEWISGSEKGIQKNIALIGKWALAVFSVRSAYSLVRSAVSTLTGENEQLATDISNIRSAMANALLPIIQLIVKWAYKLMAYINAIWKAIFGKDLFKTTEKGLDNANKSAKELRKTLAGFDEMNVLGGNTAKDSSSSNALSPSYSFNLTDQELSKIDKFKNTIDKATKPLRDFWQPFVERFIGKIFLWGSLLIDFWKKLGTGWNDFKESFGKNWGLFVDGLKESWNITKENLKQGWNDFKDRLVSGAKEGWEGIKDAFSNMSNWFSETWNNIKNGFTDIAINLGDATGKAFRSAINGVFWLIENMINLVINSINKFLNLINKLPGVELNPINPIRLPRLALAKGGIVNLPGKGVPVGGAITGEAGQEGVIPLTDSQQMALMGEAIGKYVVINLTNVTQLDGRTIARKTEQIQNSKNFAMNR